MQHTIKRAPIKRSNKTRSLEQT